MKQSETQYSNKTVKNTQSVITMCVVFVSYRLASVVLAVHCSRAGQSNVVHAN